MPKIKIMDIPFDNVSKDEAVELAFSFSKKGKQALAVTPNAEIMELCRKHEDVKKALLSAEIILPDGEGVLWTAKKLGTPLKEKVAGVEFGFECARKAAESGKSIFLLGGNPGVAQEAAQSLCSSFTRLKIAGVNHGYFARKGKENAAVVEKINESGADILFVCLGAPAQEKWACDNRASLSKVRLIVCLGGSLDIYAGKVRRAPKFFIKMRAEWLWRLLCDPRRMRRMMSLPRFMISVYKHKRNLKKMRNIK